MWKRVVVMLLLGVVYGKQAKNPAAKTHTRLPRLHHPSKRGTIITSNNNEYTGTKPYRRQEVIHALNEKNVENDDDIESYGKVIDSNEDELKKESNAKAKSFVPEGKSSRPNSITRTKELIAKIKEIQDKLFKRTNSKELADELDQMTPDSSAQLTKNKHLANLAKENVTASKLEQDFFQLEIKSLDEVIKNISAKRFIKQNEFNKTKNIINANVPKMIDDSKNPVRRKIIPEEVVDKILEKFQQLRSEAKHMALLETQRESLNEETSNKQNQGLVDSSASNPYASIGPAKENLELKNRTGVAVKSIGVDLKQDNSLSLSLADPSTISLNNQFGGVQIPIESSAADAVKDLGSVKQMPGVPLMFIKSGESLVPVYGSDSHPKISYTDTGMAQLKSNPSVGLPSLPSNIIPLSSPQQQVATFMGLNPVDQFLQTTQSMQQSSLKLPHINNFIPAQLNQVPASSRCEIPGTGCPTPTIAQLFQQASRLRQQVQQEQLEHMQQSGRNFMTLPSQQQLQQEQYFREYNQRQQQIQQLEQFKQEQQQLRAQQQQLAAGLSNFAQNNLESTNKDLHNPENIDRSQDNFPHFFPREEPLQQQQQQDEADYPINNLLIGNSPSIQTEPSTVSLINDILKTPEMPRLAAQIMDENTPFQYRNQNEQANSRNFNELPSSLTNSNSGRVQSMRTGDIQFDLKQNLARSNYPGESSMIGNSQSFNPEPLAASQMLQNYPTNPVFPLKKNPFSEANPERDDGDDRDSHYFRGKSVALNDISDPPSEQTEEEESRFRNQNPDELLNYANMRTMQRSFHPDSRPTASIDSLNLDDDRMSYDRRGTQRALMSVANGVDPSSLLDKIQGTELKGGLMGAGDPNWFSPTFKHSEDKVTISDGSPDDLLESLRKQNDKLFEKDGRALALEFRKSRLQTELGRSRAGIPDGIDPSFADEIHEPLPERFDVRSKESYLQNHLNLNTNNLFQNGHARSAYQPTDFSILSGDMVQYKHGRMSVDSSNVINSFLSESPQYRNEILRPTSSLNKNDSLHKGIVRATITKNLPDDFIELRVNGEALDDKASVRSNVKNEKKVNPSGKTFRSKGPIQIQLSHAVDKKKIINIITQSKYNVTEERKRAKIGRVKVPV